MANRARRKRVGHRLSPDERAINKAKKNAGRKRYVEGPDGTWVQEVSRKIDNKDLHSFQLGCPKGQQREMEKFYEENGIRGVKHHPVTDEAIWPDRQTQIKAAKLRGFEVD